MLPLETLLIQIIAHTEKALVAPNKAKGLWTPEMRVTTIAFAVDQSWYLLGPLGRTQVCKFVGIPERELTAYLRRWISVHV